MKIVILLQLLLLASVFGAVYNGSKNFHQLKNLKYLYLNAVASTFQIILTLMTFFYMVSVNRVDFPRNVYVVIEFLSLLVYFKSVIEKKFIRDFLRGLFYFSITVFFVTSLAGYRLIHLFYSKFCFFEALLFLTLCLIVFLQFIQNENQEKIFQQPEFVATAGIFLFFGMTSPTYYIQDEIENHYPQYEQILININYLAYFILNISFIKAFKCQMKITI